MPDGPVTRRPVSARNWGWVQAAARRLAACGVRPNWVSLASIAFAAGCAALFIVAANTALDPRSALGAAPLFVLGRGLCNVLDGLIAVEGGFRTRSGELFNDLPDRFADLLFYVPAGYLVIGLAGGVEWGWAAGAGALLTAYVRLLGGAMGAGQSFMGPMAKTQRMALFVVGCVAACVEYTLRGTTIALGVALVVIALGSLMTALRRAVRIVRELEQSR